MRIIDVILHAGQQTVAMLDPTTGEVVEMTLLHKGHNAREFYFQARCEWGSKPRSPGRTGNRMSGRPSGRDSGSRAPEAET
jgi:hypothetical protein